MNPGRIGLACAFLLIAGAAAQHGVGERLVLLGFRPDIPLVLLACVSLRLGRSGAALYGFWAGALAGALATANLGHYIASRTIAAFAVSWSKGLRFEVAWGAVALVSFLATLLTEGLWMFFAAPSDLGWFMADTIRTATYNGVLAIPLYAFVKKLLPLGPRIE